MGESFPTLESTEGGGRRTRPDEGEARRVLWKGGGGCVRGP